jgi:hypothetical protein
MNTPTAPFQKPALCILRSLCQSTAVWLIAALAATTVSALGATVRVVEFATPFRSWFGGGAGELVSVGPNLTLAVLRDGDLAQAASVDLEFQALPPGAEVRDRVSETERVAAVAGRDFLALTQRVEFQPGEALRVLSVPILDNGRRDETYRFFQGRLLSHTEGLAVATPVVTIVTGENELTTTLDVTRPTAYEAANPLVLLTRDETPRFGWFQPLEDGKTLVRGDFDAVNGVPRPGLARLYSNGDLDETFVPTEPIDPFSWYEEFVLSDGRKLELISGCCYDGELPLGLPADGESFHLRIFRADGTPDLTWSGAGFKSEGWLGKLAGRIEETQGQLCFTGPVTSIDGMTVGWIGNYKRESVFHFHLTNAPKTSLRLSVDGVRPKYSAVTNYSAVVCFRRLGATEAPATVHFATRSITGRAAQHFLPQSGTVTFAPRELGKVVTMALSPASPPEFNEIFEIVVTGGEGFEALPAPFRWMVRGTSEAFAPRLDRVHRLRDGRVLLGGFGPVEFTDIEFSLDLKAWQPLTNPLGGFFFGDDSGAGIWLDNSTTNDSARFYRAVAR